MICKLNDIHMKNDGPYLIFLSKYATKIYSKKLIIDVALYI